MKSFFLYLFIAFIILCLVVAGCGKKKQSNPAGPSAAATDTPAVNPMLTVDDQATIFVQTQTAIATLPSATQTAIAKQTLTAAPSVTAQAISTLTAQANASATVQAQATATAISAGTGFITGTLQLQSMPTRTGSTYTIFVATSINNAILGNYVNSYSGTVASTSIPFSITATAGGPYYVIAQALSPYSGGKPQLNDQLGVYGAAYPSFPSSQNVTIAQNQTVTANISLSLISNTISGYITFPAATATVTPNVSVSATATMTATVVSQVNYAVMLTSSQPNFVAGNNFVAAGNYGLIQGTVSSNTSSLYFSFPVVYPVNYYIQGFWDVNCSGIVSGGDSVGYLGPVSINPANSYTLQNFSLVQVPGATSTITPTFNAIQIATATAIAIATETAVVQTGGSGMVSGTIILPNDWKNGYQYRIFIFSDFSSANLQNPAISGTVGSSLTIPYSFETTVGNYYIMAVTAPQGSAFNPGVGDLAGIYGAIYPSMPAFQNVSIFKDQITYADLTMTSAINAVSGTISFSPALSSHASYKITLQTSSPSFTVGSPFNDSVILGEVQSTAAGGSSSISYSLPIIFPGTGCYVSAFVDIYGDGNVWGNDYDGSSTAVSIAPNTNSPNVNFIIAQQSGTMPTFTSTQTPTTFYSTTDTPTVTISPTITLTVTVTPTPLPGSIWTQATVTAPFPARDNFIACVYNNKMWVISGTDSNGAKNDVWNSAGGSSWTQVPPSSVFSARYSAAGLVYNNQMWVIGGFDGTNTNNDAWYSSDGANWYDATTITGGAAFGVRYGHTGIAYNNEMWVIGGYNGSTYYNDVWYSTDGANWSQSSNLSGIFTPRYGHSGLVFNNEMWVIAGQDSSGAKNDVWYSSDGQNWTSFSGAAFNARFSQAGVVYNNYIWVIGGYNGSNYYNDAWYSADGANWYEAVVYAGFSPRTGLAAVLFNYQMFALGGYNGSVFYNDVWWSQ